jgi:hypothetical protein
MGLCRVLVYVAASSTGIYGITGTSIWCALALGLYIVGLSFIARGEAIKTPIRYWPLLPIAAPVFLALILNADGFREPAILLSGVLGLWVVKAIRHTFWSSPPRIGVSISHLLAGIVIVDFLAILGMPRALTPAFLALFLAALLFQRIIPAT